MMLTQVSNLQSVEHVKTRDGRWLVCYQLRRAMAMLSEAVEDEWATYRKCRA